MNADRKQGRVKFVANDRRFGFVRADDGSEWYVRTSDVGGLNTGERVTFRTTAFGDGRTFALDIARESEDER